MSEEGSATGKVAYRIVAVLVSGTGAVSGVSRKHLDRNQGTPAHPCALGQVGAPPALHPATIEAAYRLAGRQEGGATDKEENKVRKRNNKMGRKKYRNKKNGNNAKDIKRNKQTTENEGRHESIKKIIKMKQTYREG